MIDWDALAASPCGWMAENSPLGGVVLSTRVRLARNLAGRPFPQRARRAERLELLHDILDRTQGVDALAGGQRLELEQVEPLPRQLLAERQIVSPDLAQTPHGRGVVIAADQCLSFMVNEEDHLRIQSLRSGLDLDGAHRAGDALDSDLGARLEFAYSERFGFLTACPTNTGTGMRASILIHLPGVVLNKEAEKLQENLRRRQLTIRGFYGEGSAALGNFFQISNTTTLGVREAEIVEKLDQAGRDLAAWEDRAREALLARARSLLEDKVWRSFGILRHARMLSAPEALNHSSLLRLGASLGLLPVPMQTLNAILIDSQPAHAQLLGRRSGGAETDAWRAEMVRRRLRPCEP